MEGEVAVSYKMVHRLQLSIKIFSDLNKAPIAFEMSQHVGKSMACVVVSLVAIFNKVAACISQLVLFNGHPSTHEPLIDLKNKSQQK